MNFVFCILNSTFAVMTYQELCNRLTPLYDRQEAVAVVRTLLDGLFGMTLTDIVGGKVSELSLDRQQEVEEKMRRLETGEPVQYVLGYAWFCGRRFSVNPSVLIPRPETEELCRLVIADCSRSDGIPAVSHSLSILDIGTGSGCIAVTLALEIKYSTVTAWDISKDAIATARDNARRLQANVDFELRDILDAEALPAGRKFDIIVSNPPYICDCERKDMEPNVLEHEPHAALFVPDDNPLLFYHAIASYASKALRHDGRLYFEVNSLYAEQLKLYLEEKGFNAVTIINDQFGKPRFVEACLSLSQE